MDVELTRDKRLGYSHTGGGYCRVVAQVTIDPNLTRYQQRQAVVHEALEACLGMVLSHDKICDIEDVVCDALQQWEPIEEEQG